VLLLLLVCVRASEQFEYFYAMYDQPWTHPADRFWSYPQLADLGFQAVYAPGRASSDMDLWVDIWANGSLEAAASGLDYICGPFYQLEVPPINYTRAVNKAGHVELNTPSPVDEAYWAWTMDRVGLAIADLSPRFRITGVVWDTEHYTRDKGEHWVYGAYSYDQAAIAKFANQTNRSIPILAAQERFAWFERNGLNAEYQRWQEETVYLMAKDTQERIHAINPDLSLGTLGFEDDCWLHLSILRGFSTPRKRVTAWHEDTYWGGYKTSKIDHNHQVFLQNGINGKVIPGLWTEQLDPYMLLSNMEFAVRYNGTFWIYQSGNPWTLGTQEQYEEAFRVWWRYVCFNGTTRPNALPSFDIYPGVQVRPHLGPEGVSAILNAGVGAVQMGLSFSELELPPTIAFAILVNRNMATQPIKGTTIPLDELDGFVYGLTEADIQATEAWGPIHELRDLIGLCSTLGLDPTPILQEDFDRVLQVFQAGEYSEAGLQAQDSLAHSYDLILEELKPLMQAGLANPRNASLPFPILNKLSIATQNIEAGKRADGQAYLLKALKDWSDIPETAPAIGIIGVALTLTTMIRHFGKPSTARPSTCSWHQARPRSPSPETPSGCGR